ncbi:MAG: type II secretion system F family protein [Desulfurococcaceae archaeon]
MSQINSRIRNVFEKTWYKLLDLILKYKWFLFIIAVLNSVVIYYISLVFPTPVTILLGGATVFGSILLIYYSQIARRLGIIPVSEDLTYILVHARCLVTGNPPLTLLFGKIGESHFYSKRYRSMFMKLRDLVKNWGYSAPEALKLVSREAKSKVDEMFLQRFSAIVATGGDVKEYLRLEYNTLFNEYKSAYSRMIDMMRVILGVYTTLLGALVFMLATLMLLGMLFGNVMELIMTGIMGLGFSLIGIDVLFFFFIKKPLFEARRTSSNKLLFFIRITGLIGLVASLIIFINLLLTGEIFSMTHVALVLIASGALFLPAAVLVKIHEGRINEYDMFFPAFIRSYGEHMAVLPDMIESLKPLLIAELGKLKNLLRGTYARLVNRIDPRIAWRNFAGESASESITRGMHIFVDTIEVGGNTGEAGALLSDHINELFRLRANYVQVFKTFEATLYIMHLIAVLLMIFIANFIDIFSTVIQSFIGAIPGEFYGILSFFSVSKAELALLTNLILITISIANILALYAVNPGSKYAIYYYASIILILTGLGLLVGTYIIKTFMGEFIQLGESP